MLNFTFLQKRIRLNRIFNVDPRFLICLFFAHCLFHVSSFAYGAEKPVFRAVTVEDNFPYNFKKENRIQGLGFDVAEMLAGRVGYKLVVEIVPWSRALMTAQNEASVLLFSVVRIPEREKNYHWIGPIVISETWLYKLASRKDIIIKKREDARAYLVGNVANNSAIPIQESLGIKIDIAPSDLSNCRKLRHGRVDLVPVDPRGIAAFVAACELTMAQIEKTVLLTDGELYLALGKNTKTETVSQFMQEFALMVKDKSLENIITLWNVKPVPSKK
jgi:polar amino acid transport system substrate-binding protein